MEESEKPTHLYMHYPKQGPWTGKLLAYGIDDGQVNEIVIPADLGIDLLQSRIAQIGAAIVICKAGSEI